MNGLSRTDILRALETLARELERFQLRAELAVVGGAALVLLYDARPSTKDVDIVPLSTTDRAKVFEAARRVAADIGLPADWLNDGAKGYVEGLALGDLLFDSSSLTVHALSPTQLLAMKLSAWRDDVDVGDARLLLTKVAGDKEHVWTSLVQYLVPGRELKARYAFEDIWETEHGPS